MPKIRQKQQAFVEEYLLDFNGTQAAIRAGYSERTARQIATKMLSKVHIQEALKATVEARNERTQIDQDFVVAGLVENYHKAMQHKPVLDREGEPIGEYVYHGSVANRSLELLGRHVGMTLADRGEVNITNVTINELNVILTGLPKVLEPFPEAKLAVVCWLDELEAETVMAALPEPPPLEGGG